VGSKYDQFYHDLSILYCKACDGTEELDRGRFDFHFALVNLDGTWSFPESLEEKAIAAAQRQRLPLAEALAYIRELSPAVMVPHMFCVEGMTRYRALFDLMGIPFLGNSDYTVWPATDKATTKHILDAHGISTPKGELLELGRKEMPTEIEVPCIVKPCNEDNSRGITLVRRPEDVAAAVAEAFRYDSRVLVETYIAGREVRGAVVEEEDGTLTLLPILEYFLKDIRSKDLKLKSNSDGKLDKDAIKGAKRENDRQCPADLSPEIVERIGKAVKMAHRALKCRHYSLFDIRIDSEGIPYILEAGLFCSFSPVSVIPSLAEQQDRPELKHPAFFHSLLDRAIREGKKANATELQKCS